MARLAWFTPLPPVRSGIAAYNVELLPLLAGRHEIDVFTGPFSPKDRTWDPALAGFPSAGTGAPASVALAVFSAHDFVWKHDRAPYDLVVYQLGNAACHDFMWPHLARYPGLVVLHDGQLHHERSRALLTRGRYDEYRAEVRYNHPDAPEHLPDLVASTLGGSLYYLYPMLRWVVRTARLVAVHSTGLARDLRTEYPGVEVERVRHGMIDPVTEQALHASAAVRARHGIPPGALLFAAFGLVTPEKRISTVLRALAGLAAKGRDVYLLLAGGTTHYYDAESVAKDLGVADRVRITGYVADEHLAAYVLAADVCLCLRWPTSRETSGTWIRAIAAGKPTIVTDLAHNSEVPAIRTAGRDADPTTAGNEQPTSRLAGRDAGFMTTVAGPARRAGQDPPVTDLAHNSEVPANAPVTLAIDILDEDESLRWAMMRLCDDGELRAALGRAAREYWALNHTMACALEDYLRAIERAMARPVPRVRDLPAHLRDDHTTTIREIAREMGIDVDLLK